MVARQLPPEGRVLGEGTADWLEQPPRLLLAGIVQPACNDITLITLCACAVGTQQHGNLWPVDVLSIDILLYKCNSCSDAVRWSMLGARQENGWQWNPNHEERHHFHQSLLLRAWGRVRYSDYVVFINQENSALPNLALTLTLTLT